VARRTMRRKGAARKGTSAHVQGVGKEPLRLT
jgi:hypothetical protein